MFNCPIKTCDEDTFLYVLQFFTTRGFKPKVLHSDYYTTFRSAKAKQRILRRKSVPPRKLRRPIPPTMANAVKRDIQTILSNVSATLHGKDFLRADVWHHALFHWIRLHNALPHSVTKSTPASVIDQSFYINAYHHYRFAFGELLCFPLQDHERTWKFDVKNDIGFYVGDEDSTKGGSLIYTQDTHPRGRTPHPHHRRTASSVVRSTARHHSQFPPILHSKGRRYGSHGQPRHHSYHERKNSTPHHPSDRRQRYTSPATHASSHPTRHCRHTYTREGANKTTDSTNTHTFDCGIPQDKTRPQPKNLLQTTRHTRCYRSTPHNHGPRKPPTSHISHRRQ